MLDSNPNSNLIIQDQILYLDQSKISPTKVIPSLNPDVEDRDKEDPLSFQTLSDKGINIGELILENTRNFENPIEEPIDNHGDIEMEFIADVNAENLE